VEEERRLPRVHEATWGLIWGAIKTGWNWLKKNWPYILGILTGPIGLATVYVVQALGSDRGVLLQGPRAHRPSDPRPVRRGQVVLPGRDQLRHRWVEQAAIRHPEDQHTLAGCRNDRGRSFGVPQIPYLAKGGHILGAGWAMVGERGPEALHLGAGATVAPLTRGGMGGP
jgi:hypothetical protein